MDERIHMDSAPCSSGAGERSCATPSLVIVGAGGHGCSVADIAISSGRRVDFFLDEGKGGQKKFDIPVLQSAEDLPRHYTHYEFVIAVGDNSTREKCASEFEHNYPNIEFATLYHPTSSVSKYASIGKGVVIAAHAHVGPYSHVGPFCIINTHASLDHDCAMGPFSSLAPGVRIGGHVQLGKRTVICIGAVIRHGVEIGDDSVIGSASYVHCSIEPNTLSYGIPAHVQRFIPKGWSYLK